MTAREWSRVALEDREVAERYMNEAPVRLGALARELGLAVKLSSLPNGVSGQISRLAQGEYRVRLNRFHGRERQRFTLAHEIAHFLLHRSEIDQRRNGIVDNALYRSGVPEPMEFEANRLAADLIMPDRLIKAERRSLIDLNPEELVDRMAKIFAVSKVAMEIRLSHRNL